MYTYPAPSPDELREQHLRAAGWRVVPVPCRLVVRHTEGAPGRGSLVTYAEGVT